jgi:radical SAM protein with 4Fe4S-binding SPASM domain
MDTDEWLGVIDEAAGLGAETLIITLPCSVSQRSDLLEVCQWAQSAHGMTVGIHLSQCCLSRDDIAHLSQLDRERLLLFVDSDCMEGLEFARDMGMRIFEADGIDDGAVQPACSLPESMACVGAEGKLYTCGLVLGDTDYFLGHIFERKLDNIMCDKSLPHEVPEGLKAGTRRCNGCPPLMAKRIADRLL